MDHFVVFFFLHKKGTSPRWPHTLLPCSTERRVHTPSPKLVRGQSNVITTVGASRDLMQKKDVEEQPQQSVEERWGISASHAFLL